MQMCTGVHLRHMALKEVTQPQVVSCLMMASGQRVMVNRRQFAGLQVQRTFVLSPKDRMLSPVIIPVAAERRFSMKMHLCVANTSSSHFFSYTETANISPRAMGSQVAY